MIARPIKPKERETLIRSLSSGVVPRIGLQHIQVGRNEELRSFVHDIDTIAEGGTSFRLVIGEYGSGKTFFLSLVRSIALEKGLVTMQADLSPRKRLHGSDGQARLLLSELVSSLSTRTKQDGNALPNILDRFIEAVKAKNPGSIERAIRDELSEIKDVSCGYSFAAVIMKYWEGYENDDDILKGNALRWLRAEYSTKTETRRDLGVGEYLGEVSIYDVLRLYTALVRKAGYKGLLVNLDEMVNIYKITSSVSRKANYEEVLYILNNTIQGTFPGIGFIMSGTPEFLTDTNRGLYSYEALRSRLAENSFAKKLGVIDYNSTVLRLANLTKEELYVLLENIRNVFASGDGSRYLVPDEALVSFLSHCSEKIGESYFRTPRTTIKSFVDFLSILEQNPSLRWDGIIDKVEVVQDVEPSGVEDILPEKGGPLKAEEDEAFASFKL